MEWIKEPIYWIEHKILHVSVPFTWKLPEVRSRLLQKSFLWDQAFVGGSAVCLMPEYFKDLKYVTIGWSYPGALQKFNPQATRTTKGCPRSCKFCGVKKINGGRPFQELHDWPDLPVIIDDNLFAASQKHFNKVIDRLIKWEWADFNQGVDARLLTQYHAERIVQIKKPMVRLALDSMNYADEWENAFTLLRQAGIAKKKIRSYALIGFDSDPAEAWQRCQWIESHGIDVLPMWFHPLNIFAKNSVTPRQHFLGWDRIERRKLFEWYYKHKRVQRHNNGIEADLKPADNILLLT